MTNIKVVQSDKLYDLNFTLQDSSGGVVNITGATLLLKVQKEHEPSLKFSGSMAIVSGAAGTCKYTVQTSDFTEAGRYLAEIEVTFGSGQVTTFTDIIITVVPQLPQS